MCSFSSALPFIYIRSHYLGPNVQYLQPKHVHVYLKWIPKLVPYCHIADNQTRMRRLCVSTKFSICPIIPLAGDIYSDTVSTACSMGIQNLKLRPLLRLISLDINNHNYGKQSA